MAEMIYHRGNQQANSTRISIHTPPRMGGQVLQDNRSAFKEQQAAQMKSDVSSNDGKSLQHEAKVTGAMATQQHNSSRAGHPPIQLVGDPTAIGTNKYAATNGGTNKTAEMRTNGSLNGSAPQVDPLGYNYIRAQGLTNHWIRFHLINEEAGGLGGAWNLVPGSKIDNGQYHSDHERSLKKTVDAALNDSTNNKEVYFGVEVQFLPTPNPSVTMTDAATPYFPTTMKVWHSTSNNAGTSWKNLKNGVDFTFNGKDGYKVPPDVTGTLSLGNPKHTGGIKSILSSGGVKYADDMYTWLQKNWDTRWAGKSAEAIEAILGEKNYNPYVTLEYVANGDKEGEGLINLSRMIALGKITQ